MVVEGGNNKKLSLVKNWDSIKRPYEPPFLQQIGFCDISSCLNGSFLIRSHTPSESASCPGSLNNEDLDRRIGQIVQ